MIPFTHNIGGAGAHSNLKDRLPAVLIDNYIYDTRLSTVRKVDVSLLDHSHVEGLFYRSQYTEHDRRSGLKDKYIV